MNWQVVGLALVWAVLLWIGLSAGDSADFTDDDL